MLTEREIQYLIEKAESCLDSNILDEALRCYNQIIQNTNPHPLYFSRRSFIYRYIGELDNAISDCNKVIELDPDDSNGYWARGACYAHKLSLQKNIAEEEKRYLLKKILSDYKASVERNPTSQEGWLAILETSMLLHDWDDAISVYGSCKPYIDSRTYQLIRAWLGCLSLIFAGDPIEDEDKQQFYDDSIRLMRNSWCVSEIDSLLIELENRGFSSQKLDMANQYHQKFLAHFDEQPMRFE